MKLRILLLLLAITGTAHLITAQKTKPVISNYSFKFKVAGLKDVDVFMGFHYGEKKFIRDTAHVNNNGEVEFAGKDTLPGGIYLFITPRKNYFEFVVNETKIQMETDTLDLVGKMVVKKSTENTVWYDYMKTIITKQKEMVKMDSVIKLGNKDSQAYKDAIAARTKTSKYIEEYRESKIKSNPDLLVSKVFGTMREVDLTQLDTSKKELIAKYFTDHYWDNFDLTDNRLIRTPVLESKLVYYFEKVVMQIPDTIIKEVDKILALTKGDKEMFKFFCHHLTYSYERSQIMCMDAVFVHLIEKYYKSGQATWVDKATMDKMIERSDKLKPLLCGAKVEDISLPDTSGNWHHLYDMKGDYTILYFWDATCSHCKKSTPVLIELYKDYLKPKGIEIYGVEGELEDKEWKKYQAEQQLPWQNVSDNPVINANPSKYVLEDKVTNLFSLNFRHHFDLYSYPVVYILDKNKNIIAKKLGVEQIKEFLEKYMRAKGK